MSSTSCILWTFVVAVLVHATPSIGEPLPTEALLRQRMAIWLQYAPMCQDHPSKNAPDGQPCNDGDMTLFSGLLCAAGVIAADGTLIGCRSVADAQDADGRWYRSPRRKLDPSIDAQEHAANIASFSPDMALGVETYLVATSDVARGQSWLSWLDSHRPCWAGTEPDCSFPMLSLTNVRGLPRFCTDLPGPPQPGELSLDTMLRALRVDPRCSMRPGDLSTLAKTLGFLENV